MMDKMLITLKLFLDELGVPDAIDTIDDRKRVQKAVYLGQLSGADLGYRFGWYLMGPYCPALTNDYYALAGAIKSEDCEIQKYELKDSLKEQLGGVKGLLRPPEGVEQERWLEALASYHFLRKVSKMRHEAAVEKLKKQKPHLDELIDAAKTKLAEFNLL